MRLTPLPRALICLERAFHSCGYGRVLNCAERRPGAERMRNRHADGMVRWASPFLRMAAGLQGRPRHVLVMLSAVIRGAHLARREAREQQGFSAAFPGNEKRARFHSDCGRKRARCHSQASTLAAAACAGSSCSAATDVRACAAFFLATASISLRRLSWLASLEPGS